MKCMKDKVLVHTYARICACNYIPKVAHTYLHAHAHKLNNPHMLFIKFITRVGQDRNLCTVLYRMYGQLFC